MTASILIFDKSVLESLNKEEALLLERYFFANIPSVLFLEVLADLKEAPREIYKSAEDRVASLAEKLPITSTNISASHQTLVSSEFEGGLYGHPVPMKGVCVPSQHPRISTNASGKVSHYYEESHEEKAMSAWRGRRFNDLDQLLAAQWQATQKDLNTNELAEKLGKELSASGIPKFKEITQVKAYVDEQLKFLNAEKAFLLLKMMLSHFSADAKRTNFVLATWKLLCRKNKRIIPPLVMFPYAHYVLSVDMFYQIALAQRLVESSKKSKSHIDLQYIYYLPFCMSFASKDNFHRKVVPLFLRKDQNFIDGERLKSSLKNISEYLKNMGDADKAKRHSSYPPRLKDCIVCETYDIHNKSWEKAAARPISLDKEKEAELVKKMLADIDNTKKNGRRAALTAEPDTVTKVHRLTRQQMKDRFGLSDEKIDELIAAEEKNGSS
jgi:hypothetical protein